MLREYQSPPSTSQHHLVAPSETHSLQIQPHHPGYVIGTLLRPGLEAFIDFGSATFHFIESLLPRFPGAAAINIESMFQPENACSVDKRLQQLLPANPQSELTQSLTLNEKNFIRNLKVLTQAAAYAPSDHDLLRKILIHIETYLQHNHLTRLPSQLRLVVEILSESLTSNQLQTLENGAPKNPTSQSMTAEQYCSIFHAAVQAVITDGQYKTDTIALRVLRQLVDEYKGKYDTEKTKDILRQLSEYNYRLMISPINPFTEKPNPFRAS